MLTCYDLFDLYAILIRVRSDPADPMHTVALEQVLPVLTRQKTCHGLNQFRTAIAAHLAEDAAGTYAFCRVENDYTYFPYPALNDEDAYELLREACETLLAALRYRTKEQVIAMADCLHNLPVQVAREGRIPRSFWTREVKVYRKQWDKDFLAGIERALR